MTSSSDAATNSNFDWQKDLFLPLFYTNKDINLDVYFHLVEVRLSKIIVIKFKSSIYLQWLQLESFASELWGDWTSPIACRCVGDPRPSLLQILQV